MNTDELKKLYKDVKSDAAPDFWDRIETELKPHSELSEEERNAFSGFEAIYRENRTTTEFGGEENFREVQYQDRERNHVPVRTVSDRKRKRGHIIGWVAAAAVLVICVPAVFLLTGRNNRQSAQPVYEMAQVYQEEAAAMPAAEALPEKIAKETDEVYEGKLQEAETEYAMNAAEEERPVMMEKAAEAYETAPRAVLLTAPENAVTLPADTEYFTEELLADADMLAIVSVESAAFESDNEGRAYRICYDVTVEESLLEEGESGKKGSRLRILSPIVSTGAPGDPILYQLVPGETYILPLKKNGGDWELLSPFAPQIRLHDDGSFEFHTGYSSLLNEDTEVVFDQKASEDDFWFDRKVSRSDPDFVEDLTELVKIVKESK